MLLHRAQASTSGDKGVSSRLLSSSEPATGRRDVKQYRGHLYFQCELGEQNVRYSYGEVGVAGPRLCASALAASHYMQACLPRS